MQEAMGLKKMRIAWMLTAPCSPEANSASQTLMKELVSFLMDSKCKLY